MLGRGFTNAGTSILSHLPMIVFLYFPLALVTSFVFLPNTPVSNAMVPELIQIYECLLGERWGGSHGEPL